MYNSLKTVSNNKKASYVVDTRINGFYTILKCLFANSYNKLNAICITSIHNLWAIYCNGNNKGSTTRHNDLKCYTYTIIGLDTIVYQGHKTTDKQVYIEKKVSL